MGAPPVPLALLRDTLRRQRRRSPMLSPSQAARLIGLERLPPTVAATTVVLAALLAALGERLALPIDIGLGEVPDAEEAATEA